MDIAFLINHPERMDRDTLYELRSILALYPYFQTARLLLLQNLFLLHDASFDSELRRAAIYITDRRKIFQMIEMGHYQLKRPEPKPAEPAAGANRTLALIDNFLSGLPEDEPASKRKPTPADATVDYVAYLLETENEGSAAATPQLKGQSLIDSFIEQDKGRPQLNENPTLKPDTEASSLPADESCFTETLARIYIKQGQYERALDIIKRINLANPNKNIYFADQIRFLQKLIINNNTK